MSVPLSGRDMERMREESHSYSANEILQGIEWRLAQFFSKRPTREDLVIEDRHRGAGKTADPSVEFSTPFLTGSINRFNRLNRKQEREVSLSCLSNYISTIRCSHRYYDLVILTWYPYV